MVFNEVNLDASASFDIDGLIISYYWTLKHRISSNNDKESTEVSPTISDLAAGFYDVCLYVTDDDGQTDKDCLVLAAAGSCSCALNSIHVESIVPTTARGSK